MLITLTQLLYVFFVWPFLEKKFYINLTLSDISLNFAYLTHQLSYHKRDTQREGIPKFFSS